MSARAAALVAALLACSCALASGAGIAPFSAAKPGGDLPAGWRALALPRVPAPVFSLVEDSGVTVLRSRAAAAAGTRPHAPDALPPRPPPPPLSAPRSAGRPAPPPSVPPPRYAAGPPAIGHSPRAAAS